MDFLELNGKSILVFGVANRKSVAWHIARVVQQAGARVVYVVRNEQVRQSAAKLLGGASVVTISISTTRMAAENYGLMGPVKAALDASLAFLAKSFSKFSRVRFNAVGPSLLKTSASAGIPGYVDAYLYAEQVIPRRRAVQTEEAANVAAFLLSPRSSGVNARTIVVDAGMSINYFDRELIRRVMDSPGPGA